MGPGYPQLKEHQTVLRREPSRASIAPISHRHPISRETPGSGITGCGTRVTAALLPGCTGPLRGVGAARVGSVGCRHRAGKESPGIYRGVFLSAAAAGHSLLIRFLGWCPLVRKLSKLKSQNLQCPLSMSMNHRPLLVLSKSSLVKLNL